MEKKIILTFLVVAGIVALGIFFLYDPDAENRGKDRIGKIVDETDEGGQTETPTQTIGAGGSGSSGSSGGSGTGGGNEDGRSLENGTDVDVYSSPCGVYFGEYGICAGTCPLGNCVQEGKSCYCKY